MTNWTRAQKLVEVFLVLLLLAGALPLAGCDSGGGTPVTLTDVFPETGTLAGWTVTGQVEMYDRENLYDLVDGQAESFFVYGFEQVATRDYENAEGVVLRITVWQLASPADAYGLFTTSISGEPAAIGNDGDGDPGRRLAFWQDRYYVTVNARKTLPEAEVENAAKAVSARLPSGGARPALMDRLPPDGLVPRRAIFFHEEISIQSDIWLGGENVMGLSAETDGALARYDIGGAQVYLLLVQYPNANAASAGLKALQGSDQVDDLVIADARDKLLGAIFGPIDQAVAGTLLASALDGS